MSRLIHLHLAQGIRLHHQLAVGSQHRDRRSHQEGADGDGEHRGDHRGREQESPILDPGHEERHRRAGGNRQEHRHRHAVAAHGKSEETADQKPAQCDQREPHCPSLTSAQSEQYHADEPESHEPTKRRHELQPRRQGAVVVEVDVVGELVVAVDAEHLLPLVPQPPAELGLVGPGADRRAERGQDGVVAFFHQRDVTIRSHHVHESRVGRLAVGLDHRLGSPCREGDHGSPDDEVAHREWRDRDDDRGGETEPPAFPVRARGLVEQEDDRTGGQQDHARRTQQITRRETRPGQDAELETAFLPQSNEQPDGQEGERDVE